MEPSSDADFSASLATDEFAFESTIAEAGRKYATAATSNARFNSTSKIVKNVITPIISALPVPRLEIDTQAAFTANRGHHAKL
jgi:hypothetical protein